MAAERNAARFFSADQHIFLEHIIGNVVKANRRLVHGQAIALGQPVNHARGRDGAHHRPAPAALLYQVAQRERHDPVGVHKIAAPIHSASAVSIPIRGQAQVAHAGAHGAGQRPQVTGDWLRMHAAKARVHLAADLNHLTAGALQDALDHAAPRAEHRVDHHALRVIGNGVEVDQLAQMLIISQQRVEALDQAQLARLVKVHQVRPAGALFIVI